MVPNPNPKKGSVRGVLDCWGKESLDEIRLFDIQWSKMLLPIHQIMFFVCLSVSTSVLMTIVVPNYRHFLLRTCSLSTFIQASLGRCQANKKEREKIKMAKRIFRECQFIKTILNATLEWVIVAYHLIFFFPHRNNLFKLVIYPGLGNIRGGSSPTHLFGLQNALYTLNALV